MTDEQLSEIEKRVNAATAGPWESSTQRGAPGHCIVAQVFGPDELGGVSIAALDYSRKATADAKFIAHAREDVPALIAEVRRLQTQIDKFVVLRAMLQARKDAGTLKGFGLTDAIDLIDFTLQTQEQHGTSIQV